MSADPQRLMPRSIDLEPPSSSVATRLRRVRGERSQAGTMGMMVMPDVSELGIGDLRVVAVMPVQDEATTLPLVLQQLRRLPIRDAAIVINGSSDASIDIARVSGYRTVIYHESLGHDVGRAIGARIVNGDIYLFVDADIVIQAEDLVPFLRAVAGGVDVALNDLAPIVGGGADAVSTAKAFLNKVLGRPDLGIASLTGVPNALSRRAVDTITPARLAVPPLAHAMALIEGLNVQVVHAIDVVRANRMHPEGSPGRSQVRLGEAILGDHIEALHYVTAQLGPRGGFHDMQRRRDLLL